MKSVVAALLQQALDTIIQKGCIPKTESFEVSVARVKQHLHGDYTCHTALLLAKICQQSAQSIAQSLVQSIPKHPMIERVEIVDPGFINVYLHANMRHAVLAHILKEQARFGICDTSLVKQQMHMFLSEAWRTKVIFVTRPLMFDDIQYAHARTCGVFRQLEAHGWVFSAQQGLSCLYLLNAPEEEALIAILERYPDVVEQTAKMYDPCHMVYYLQELAKAVHSYYNVLVLLCEQEPLQCARCCLLKAVRQVLWNGLQLLGISAFENV